VPAAGAEPLVSAAVVADGAFGEGPGMLLSTADGRLLTCVAGEPAARTPPVPRAGTSSATHVAALADGHGMRCYTAGPDPVLRVTGPDGRRSPDVPLPGSGAVSGIAATRASFTPGRIDLAVQRGREMLHLVQQDGPDAPWRIAAARSRVLPGPAIPPGVHRRA
jgi:hypothetical protein